MNDEQRIEVVDTPADDMTQDYLSAIKEIKSKSVDRSEYDALRAENKKLLDAVVNGSYGEKQPEEPAKPTKEDIQKLREELFTIDSNLNNLQYVTKSLQLRDALMQNGEADPFLPVGKRINPTAEDIAACERAAQVYAECVEYAQGDSEAFTNELMRRTRDVRIR